MCKLDKATTSTSISFPNYLLDLVDHYCRLRHKSRTGFVCSAAFKEIVMQKRKVSLLKIYENREGGDLDMKPEKVELTVPKFFKEVAERHADNFGADLNDFYLIAALQYLLIKEGALQDIRFLVDEIERGNEADFDGIVS